MKDLGFTYHESGTGRTNACGICIAANDFGGASVMSSTNESAKDTNKEVFIFVL